MSEPIDPAAVMAARRRHGVGLSTDINGNVQHLTSPILGQVRYWHEGGRGAEPDWDWILDRLEAVRLLAAEAQVERDRLAEELAEHKRMARVDADSILRLHDEREAAQAALAEHERSAGLTGDGCVPAAAYNDAAEALAAEQAKVARVVEMAHRFELVPRARLLGALTAKAKP